MNEKTAYSFDNYGNLSPYTFITIDNLVEFEEKFVADFSRSLSRQRLFTGLLEYLGDIGMLLADLNYKGTWHVWLNGSFTTNKVNPVDIDLLNVFDSDALFEQHKDLFEPLFAENAESRYGVDAYFLLRNASARATELTTYWQQQFGTDRNGRTKGIIVLDILFG